MRGLDDLGKVDLGGIDAEEVEKLCVVLELVNVHEQCARGIRRVGDEDVLLGTSVQLVHQPGIDGTEGKVAGLVGLLDSRYVLNQPQELGARWVCRERETAKLSHACGAETLLEVAYELSRTGVGPDNGVVKGLASRGVPNKGGLSLVGDTDSLDIGCRVTLLLKLLDGPVDTCLYG